MKMRYSIVTCVVSFVVMVIHAQGSTMKITSPSFDNGGTIPAAHTCDGQDTSPALSWSDIPTGTKSLVLMCDDPDAPAGLWTHWIVFNISPTTNKFSSGQDCHAIGAQLGANSWNKASYGGPCPPSGTHRYYFTLYALDTTLPLKNGAPRSAIEQAMTGHTLAQTKIMARYARNKK
jgi:Raf kinase inhibitor-like YbhB/YbcL family protein